MALTENVCELECPFQILFSYVCGTYGYSNSSLWVW